MQYNWSRMIKLSINKAHLSVNKGSVANVLIKGTEGSDLDIIRICVFVYE